MSQSTIDNRQSTNHRLAMALAVLGAAALVGVVAQADIVQITDYATINLPGQLTFDGAGNLFVGNDNNSGAVNIYKIPAGGGAPVSFGNTGLSDPDAVAWDRDGVISGVPGSILVGTGATSGHIWSYAPNGTLNPSSLSIGSNPSDMAFTSDMQKLYVADPPTGVYSLSGSTPQWLATPPAFSSPIALNSSNEVYASSLDGSIRRYQNGAWSTFASGLSTTTNQVIPITFGPGGAWGTDLYAIANGNLLRIDSGGNKTVVKTGLSNAQYAYVDMGFSPTNGALYVSALNSGKILQLTDTPSSVLSGVPDYRWNYGCTPTSAGMLIAYWDRNGFGNLVSDSATVAPLTSSPQNADRPGNYSANGYNTGATSNATVDALIASIGHHRDYWAHGLGPGAGANNDPMLDQHANDSLADFLGTSRGPLDNGYTYAMYFNAQCPGTKQALKAWATYSGYSAGQIQPGADDANPTFAKLKTEIDNSRPVILDLSLSGGDPSNFAGHTVVAYGYRDEGAGAQWFAVRDTWQDGNSDGDFKIHAQVDANGVEWWKWNLSHDSTSTNRTAYVFQMNTFYLTSTATTANAITSVSDNFARVSGGELGSSLGYKVVDSSPGAVGIVNIIASPLDAADSVLHLSSLTGDALAISTDGKYSPFVQVDFDYLFGDAGKIDVSIGGIDLFTLNNPAFGDGSAGATAFGHYAGDFDLVALGIDPLQFQEFRLTLSGTADPTVYVDNLSVVGVPEPASLMVLALGGVGLLMRRRRW